MRHKHKWVYGWENFNSDTAILTVTIRTCFNCSLYQRGIWRRILGIKIFIVLKVKRNNAAIKYDKRQRERLLTDHLYNKKFWIGNKV